MNLYEMRLWDELLKRKKCEYSVAREALDQIFVEFPPKDNYGKLPSLKKFQEIYTRLITPKMVNTFCSCCDGTTFLVFRYSNSKELAMDCDCYLDAGMPPRTNDFKECGFEKCDAIDCPNPGRRETVVVPKGNWKYYKKVLKTCPYVKAITEEVEG